MAVDTLYDDDFVLWAERQAESLRLGAREGSSLPLDWENLAEEIESVGRSERRRVGTLVSNIIAHLLTLACSPSDRDRSGWESEIGSARDYLRRTLDESPSLKPGFPDIVAREQPGAARAAVRSLRKYGERDAAARLEAGAPTITAEQVLDDEFYLPGSFPTPEQTLP